MNHSRAPSFATLDFEAIFGATGSAYLMLDAALYIVGVNHAYLRATGRSRESLLGKYIFVAFPDNPSDPAADGVKNLHQSLMRVLATGEPDRLAFLKYDIPTGENGEFEVRYWSPINTPVFDGAGKLTHIIHHAEDITGRVASEQALRESEHRFRALTNATGDVIYRMNPDWTRMHELDGRGFLKDTAVVGDYRLEDYVQPEDQQRARAAIDRAIRDKATFELEHRVLRADGGCGWTYSRAVPILDAAGEIREWIGSASDITARKVAEEQLRESNRRKDEFLAMLAHELRNPLAPISAAAHLLQVAQHDEARVRHASQIIERQAAHMTNLVDDLLDVSRVTRGLVQLENVPLDIRHAVADAIEQATPLIQARRHHLEVELAPASTMVVGDKKRLVQAIANLLNNAAKFTHPGGTIVLATEVVDAQVRIEVSDNGIGMSRDLAMHAFDLFTQAERSADRTSGGLGLGLALVKSLVELHGGTISSASPGLGQGSTFAISLPRWEEVPAGEAPAGTASLVAQPADRLRILVVDDNVDAAETLAMLLDALGHEVLVEHGSAEALERARQVQPQVCLLDIGLPDMDGNELARRLRGRPETAGAMLVAVTGYGQEAERMRAVGAGFDHHMVKPVDLHRLCAVLALARGG